MTIEITQPKIASLAPEWRGFRGVSILFGSLGPQVRDDAVATAGHLFARLGKLVADLPADPWRMHYGFCPLPVDSYHMTLADLVHDGNVGKLTGPMANAFDGAPLQSGQEYPAALAAMVDQSGLLDTGSDVLAFTVDRLVIMNRSALVVTLRPVDEGLFARLMVARARLADMMLERLGVATQPYIPHVTLGYFANKDVADLAIEAVQEMAATLVHDYDKASFIFAKPQPYIFSDMAHFLPVSHGLS
jgi:hypothetical protein